MNERRWYADWRVWVSMVLLALCGLAQAVVGLPFRIFHTISNLLFG